MKKKQCDVHVVITDELDDLLRRLAIVRGKAKSVVMREITECVISDKKLLTKIFDLSENDTKMIFGINE